MWIYIWFGLAMLEAAVILWLVARVMRLGDEVQQWCDRWGGECFSALRARTALREVIDQETPNANATVKRMARMAREALS